MNEACQTSEEASTHDDICRHMTTYDDICKHTSTYVTNLSYTNLSYPDLSSSSSVTSNDRDTTVLQSYDDRTTTVVQPSSSEARPETGTEETDRTDDDDEKRNLYQRIEEQARKAGLTLNDVIFRDLTEQYSEQEIMNAIDEAGKHNAYAFKYVFKILANQKAGIEKPSTSPEQTKPVKPLNGQNYTQREYTVDEMKRHEMYAWNTIDDDLKD